MEPSRLPQSAAMQDMLQAVLSGAEGYPSAPLPELHGVIPLAKLERHAIRHALVRTEGDTTVAARLLGIGRTTLYRKIKEYRLEADLRSSRPGRCNPSDDLRRVLRDALRDSHS
jgi:transcriptional regulator of acetoin/glycerol metabolism